MRNVEHTILDVLDEYHWRAQKSLERELMDRYHLSADEVIEALKALHGAGLITGERAWRWRRTNKERESK